MVYMCFGLKKKLDGDQIVVKDIAIMSTLLHFATILRDDVLEYLHCTEKWSPLRYWNLLVHASIRKGLGQEGTRSFFIWRVIQAQHEVLQ